MASKAVARYKKTRERADIFGDVLVEGFHLLALFAIGAATVWSAVIAFFGMVEQGHATIKDILLLFIYLELGAMVGIYFKTKHLPVRYLIYVAITALTRLMIDIVSGDHNPGLDVAIIAGAILLLAFAVLVLRFASSKFPSRSSEEQTDFADDTPDRKASSR